MMLVAGISFQDLYCKVDNRKERSVALAQYASRIPLNGPKCNVDHIKHLIQFMTNSGSSDVSSAAKQINTVIPKKCSHNSSSNNDSVSEKDEYAQTNTNSGSSDMNMGFDIGALMRGATQINI